MQDKERRWQQKRETLRRFCAGSQKLREEREVRLAEAEISSDDEAMMLFFRGELSLEKYSYLLHGNTRYSRAEIRTFCRGLNKLKWEQLARITAVGYSSEEQVTELYLQGQISLESYMDMLHGSDR